MRPSFPDVKTDLYEKLYHPSPRLICDKVTLQTACRAPDGDTVTEDTFKNVIDNHILDLEKKIEKGYVYTIKKKK